jgi:hypothetical protein
MRCDRASFSWSAVQVRTYDVVPVSSSLGLVEFVPATQPLKQAIMAYLDPEVRRLRASIAILVQERILACVGKILANSVLSCRLLGMPKLLVVQLPVQLFWRDLRPILGLSGKVLQQHLTGYVTAHGKSMSERNRCTLQVEAKAMEQYSTNIADLAKGSMDMYGQYLGSFQASAEAVASNFHAVEAMLRWDALRQVIP